MLRNSHRRSSIEKAALKSFTIFTGKYFIKIRLPTRVLPYEYCEIFKNICFEEHLQTAASFWMLYKGNTYVLFKSCIHSTFMLKNIEAVA